MVRQNYQLNAHECEQTPGDSEGQRSLTCCSRESRPHPEEPRFCLLAREEGSFPCVVRKEFPAFPSHLKRRRSPQESREELQGPTTIPSVPQMSPSIPGKPGFPALPRLSSRGSTHTTVARGTALWESLVGEPRWKASRESA